MQHIDALVRDLNDTSTQVRRLAVSLQGTADDVSPQIRQLATRLNATADNLEQATAGINRFVAENRTTVTDFTQGGLPQLQRTLDEARSAAEAFRELSRSLKDDPSQLIYQPARHGVEVKR